MLSEESKETRFTSWDSPDSESEKPHKGEKPTSTHEHSTARHNHTVDEEIWRHPASVGNYYGNFETV